MSIVSTTRCGMLGYKLTDEIVQKNLGFNNEIFKEFGYFFGIGNTGHSSFISKLFIHKDYPNLIITKVKSFGDMYLYFILYIPCGEVFGKVLLSNWKKFQQAPEYSRFKEVELQYVYCGNNLVNNGYDVMNFIEKHKDFLEKSAKSIYEAANFLIKNTDQYKEITL